jgi:hypothetical protein
VGGSFGYERFLEAVSDPDHEEHRDYLTWVGGQFDPGAFDLSSVSFDDPGKRWGYAFAVQ